MKSPGFADRKKTDEALCPEAFKVLDVRPTFERLAVAISTCIDPPSAIRP